MMGSVLAGCGGNDPQEVALKDQVGQMLMVGFRGTALSPGDPIVSDLEDRNLGGVILYEKDGPSQSRPRNIESPEQVKRLVQDLKFHGRQTPFVAIDQEGGNVSRLKERYGFPASVSAHYLGEQNDEALTRHEASIMAATLEEMGINVNFAPVVDVNINPDSPAIGRLGRSFSDDPDQVTFHAGIVIEEHDKRGIVSCCKHFPGHGSAEDDSHLGLTDVTATWSPLELAPYRQLIADGKCRMIMSAHVFNQTLDADYPATLSEKILTGILREELGFTGVIVSDAMEMGAIQETFGTKEAIEKAINAGCDVLVFSNNITTYNPHIVAEAIEIILGLVDEGRIRKERIRRSYDRIMAIKESLE